MTIRLTPRGAAMSTVSVCPDRRVGRRPGRGHAGRGSENRRHDSEPAPHWNTRT
jgi:hypothetical protein